MRHSNSFKNLQYVKLSTLYKHYNLSEMSLVFQGCVGTLLGRLTLLVPLVAGVLQRQADWTVVPRTVLPVGDDLSGWCTVSHCGEIKLKKQRVRRKDWTHGMRNSWIKRSNSAPSSSTVKTSFHRWWCNMQISSCCKWANASRASHSV